MADPGVSPTALGAALRELREERKLTQEVLAQRSSVGVRVVAGIERGDGNPTWATLTSILGGMKASLGELAEKIEGR